MRRCSGIFLVLAGAVVGWNGPSHAAIAPAQVDTFENGTTQSWSNGANNPSPAANVSTGGPAGLDDNYLRLVSNGTGSGGGRLVAFNLDQWSGNYLAAEVDGIRMQVNNFGLNDLVLRLILVNFAAGQSLTTTLPVNLPAGSGWTLVTFPLVPQNLTGGNYDTVMANVSELNLLHSPSVVVSRALSPPIAAQLGVDNIAALPEPGLIGLMGMAALLIQRRPRRPDARALNVMAFAVD